MADDFLLFQKPESPDSRGPVQQTAHTFSLGSYNVDLIRLILRFNGLSHSPRPPSTLFWGTSRESDSLSNPESYGRVNHFPNSSELLCNKSEFASILQNHPRFKHFPQFFPQTFTFFKQREELYNVMKARPLSLFIAKPPGGSCGHGIRLVRFAEFESIPRNYVVSEYISSPLCIDGFKFDLRIYVLVTSFAPLRAFLYREGLARFATETYSNHTTDVFSHLTNATLNKRGRNWSTESKWKLSELLAELRTRFGKPESEIMSRIVDVVSVTLALVQPSMAASSRPNCFELFGFDLLVDRDFNLWVLELNSFPSMGFRSETDWAVKVPLIAQTLSIVGVGQPCTARNAVAVEDSQNERSGNGFLRLFPSSDTRWLANLCVPAPNCRVSSGDSSLQIAEKLNPQQASWVLLRYLSEIEKQFRSGRLPGKVRARVHNFLAAQGFESGRLASQLKVVLHTYVMKETGLLVQANVDTSFFGTIPESVELSEVLGHCLHFSIPHTAFLFE
jgi:tubulin polyglutamylase TTLL5